MVGAPTRLATVTWHFGRRKPEVAQALAELRAGELAVKMARLKQLVRENPRRKEPEDIRASVDAEGADSDADEPRDSAAPPIDRGALRRSVAFVTPALAYGAAMHFLSAPDAVDTGLRICSSLSPDAIRAALAGLGDLSASTAWVQRGDAARRALAQSLGFARIAELHQDPATLLGRSTAGLAELRGAERGGVHRRIGAAWHALMSADEDDPGNPISLAALLDGLASRGAPLAQVSGPKQLAPFFAWLASEAALRPDGPKFTVIAGEELREPERYPADRWLTNYRLAAAMPESEGSDLAHRERRLIGAGVPLVSVELPSRDALISECMRWTMALELDGKRHLKHGEEDGPLPADPEAALRDGPLAIYTGSATHAYVLRKVAGTLGKTAETSVPAWLAAQAAMGDHGDYVSLHWLGLPTHEARETLSDLQRTLSGPNQLAVRTSFSLPEFDGGHPLAGASSRGLFFILSDGGGAELFGSRRAALGAEERTLALLADAGRRAILLRAEDGDASKLASALRGAGALLTP